MSRSRSSLVAVVVISGCATAQDLGSRTEANEGDAAVVPTSTASPPASATVTSAPTAPPGAGGGNAGTGTSSDAGADAPSGGDASSASQAGGSTSTGGTGQGGVGATGGSGGSAQGGSGTAGTPTGGAGGTLNCASNEKACGETCVPENSATYGCGATGCTPCSAPLNGFATCAAGACDFRCASGYQISGASCAAVTVSDFCQDGLRNGGETGVDCGGPECAACGAGFACGTNADCQSSSCVSGTCAASSCTDGIQNAAESDVDCGGGCGSNCLSGASCNGNADCYGTCIGGACACTPLTCADYPGACGVQSDGCGATVDCATACTSGVCFQGSCCDPITTCPSSAECGIVDDTCGGSFDCGGCPSGFSCGSANQCVDHCQNGVLDSGEFGVDCGGACTPCGFRLPLTIAAGSVSADLSSFPVLVDITNAALFTESRADGADVAFRNGAQALLDFEVELWDTTAQRLLAWVKLPTVAASSDTVFYLHYGDGSATSLANAAGVWSADFRAVYHMDYGGGAGTEPDSTANANHLSPDTGSCSSSAPVDQPSGNIGRALTFGGDSCDRLIASDSASLDLSGDATFSAWVRRPGTAAGSKVLLTKRARRTEETNYQVGLGAAWNMYFMWGWGTGNYPSIESTPAATPQQNEWAHLVWTVSGNPKGLRTYVNGTRINGSDQTTSTGGTPSNRQLALTPNNQLLFVGSADQETDEVFLGDLDEVRIAGSARSAAWIAAEYENQRTGSAFVGVGPTQPF